jgi:cysteine-rich repeat protein
MPDMCGDGMIGGTEACDDGDIDDGDGCSAMCVVEDGWDCTGMPSICTDIDECTLNTDNCDANATCTNTPGSFTCACNMGFSGNGVTCAPVGTLSFSASRYNGSEGASVVVNVSRDGGTAGAVDVTFATSDGTAVAGADYQASTGTLSFPDGSSSQTFMVTLTDDMVEEGPKVLNLALSNPTGGATLGVQSTATLTIRDNDAVLLGLTAANNVVRFASGAPGTIISTTAVTGLQAGETLVGIDHRPNNGVLYGVGSTERLYVINLTTGAATSQSPTLLGLSGTAFGLDFNPTVDRIRVVSDNEQNLRLTGAAVKTTDMMLQFAAADANAGANPNVVGAAYTNNFAGAVATTLYNIDSNLDVLVTQNPPNNGTLNTVGALGFDTTANVGFDISSVNTALASVHAAGETESRLVHVDLPTGSVFEVGAVAAGAPLVGLTIVPPAPPVQNRIFGVTTAGNLVRFDPANPGTLLTTVALSGITGVIGGMDFRPSDGQLYAVTEDNRLYVINIATGAGTQVGADGAFALMGGSFGIDFNPVPDRLRAISSEDQNLRLNPFDGTLTATDTPLAYAPGDVNAGANPVIVGSAYTNSFPGTTMTMLYNIDSALDIVVLQNPPNAGTLNTVAALGFDTDNRVGFDISRLNQAYASLTAPGATESALFTLNLATNTITQVGTIGGGAALIALAIAPAGTP